MEIDIEHELAVVDRRVRQAEEQAAAQVARAGRISGRATSPDGGISVEVAPGGLLTDVRLSPAALSADMETLARQITVLAEPGDPASPAANMHKALRRRGRREAPGVARLRPGRGRGRRRRHGLRRPAAPPRAGRATSMIDREPLNRTTKQLIEDGRARQDALSKVDTMLARVTGTARDRDGNRRGHRRRPGQARAAPARPRGGPPRPGRPRPADRRGRPRRDGRRHPVRLQQGGPAARRQPDPRARAALRPHHPRPPCATTAASRRRSSRPAATSGCAVRPRKPPLKGLRTAATTPPMSSRRSTHPRYAPTGDPSRCRHHVECRRSVCRWIA